MKNEEKLRSASVPKLILSLSLPMVLVMLVNVLYNMADVFFMGRTGNTMAVAGVSLTGPVFSGISAFNTLIGFGGCTAVSIALGKGDRDIVRKYTSFVTYAALALGVVLAVLLLSFSEGLLTILGTNEETRQHAKDYLSILALGAPFMLTAGALGNTIRADGESRIPMLVALLTNGLNIALDALFILRLGWGAKGAAAATVISNAVNFIIVLIIAAGKSSFSLSPKDFTLRRQVSVNVLSLGVPMAAGTLLMSIAHIFSNRLMVQYGNLAVAAGSAAGKVSMLIPMIIMGICMGVQPDVLCLRHAEPGKAASDRTGHRLVRASVRRVSFSIFRGFPITAHYVFSAGSRSAGAGKTDDHWPCGFGAGLCGLPDVLMLSAVCRQCQKSHAYLASAAGHRIYSRGLHDERVVPTERNDLFLRRSGRHFRRHRSVSLLPGFRFNGGRANKPVTAIT